MTEAPWLELDPARLAPRVLEAPVSKSDALRALVLAYALDWPELAARVEASDAVLPRDVERARRGLRQLATAGDQQVEIDCGDGAAPLRFLLAQAAALPNVRVRFTGTPRLGERPHGSLVSALLHTLEPAGLFIERGAAWPIEVRGAGRAATPVFRASGGESSQFASSLLLAAAALARREGRRWTVEVGEPCTSRGYLALTLAWLARCGVPVAREGGAYLVGRGERPEAVPALPHDWSSASYLLLIAWRRKAVVRGLGSWRLHPDAAVLGHLACVGLTVEPSGEGRVRVVGRARGGLRASAATSPDLIPTLAALACVLDRPSVFTDASVLRLKESDRLEGTLALVRAAGATASVQGETLRVSPVAKAPRGFTFSSRGDHRLAMAAATLAVLLGARLRLSEPDCVDKSFPGFWAQLGAPFGAAALG